MEMAYVSKETTELARDWERRFQLLPPEAGVVFIGIAPIAQPGGQSNSFNIHLGISREFDENTGHALVHHVLAKEEQQGLNLFVHVFRGVAGSSRGWTSSLRDRLAPVGGRSGS